MPTYHKIDEDRRVLATGYVEVHAPDHPLTHRSDGWVAEHRKVLYDALMLDYLFGEADDLDELPCHWCGWRLPWRHEKGVQYCINVDHLDADRIHNVPENLVVSCMWCNSTRSWQSFNPSLWAEWVTEYCELPPWERPGSGRWMAYLLAQMPREQVDAAVIQARNLFPPVPKVPEQLLAGDLFD